MFRFAPPDFARLQLATSWHSCRTPACLLVLLLSGCAPLHAAARPLSSRHGAAAAPLIVSVSNPFRRCGQHRSGLDATAEPTLALVPASGRRRLALVAAWIQGRTVGITTAKRAVDSGKWSVDAAPLTICAAPASPFDEAADPWVSAGPDGTVYLSAIVRRRLKALPHARTPVYTWDVVVVSSHDGRAWGPIHTVARGSGSDTHPDKPSITADPTRPGRAYVVWSGGIFTQSGSESSGWFSATRDFGRTWIRPHMIVRSMPNSPYSNLHTLLADPHTHALEDIYYVSGSHRTSFIVPRHLASTESRDGGRTWSHPAILAADEYTVAAEAYGETVRGGFSLSAAMDPSSGRRYVTWQDARCHEGRSGGVAIISRPSGSGSWSRLVCLSEKQPAFLPTVAVNSTGVVAVSFYRILDISAYNDFTADFVICVSHDAGRRFPACTEIARPFNIARATYILGMEPGYFVGDYEGMVAAGRFFVTVFVGPIPSSRGRRLGAVSATITPPGP